MKGAFLRWVALAALTLSVLGTAHAQSLGGPQKRGASLTGANTLSLAAVTVPSISASQNNLNPGTTSNRFRISSTAAYSITGWVAATEGWVLCLENVGSFAITLPHNSASSDPEKRWQNGVTGADVVLSPGDLACYQYSTGSVNRWVMSSFPMYPARVADIAVARTGGTMTGTLVLSATTDISTETNGNLTIDPAGSGIVDIVGNMRLSLSSGKSISITGGNAPDNAANTGMYISGPNIGAIVVEGFNNYGLLLGTSVAAAAAVNTVTIGEQCAPGSACTGAKSAAFYGNGLAAFGNSHQTASITGAANLDPQSSRIILICATAASSFAITMQETTVAATPSLSFAHGADVTICSSQASNASCTLTFADVANVFDGSSSSLGVGDCITMFYADEANDLWVQTGFQNN